MKRIKISAMVTLVILIMYALSWGAYKTAMITKIEYGRYQQRQSEKAVVADYSHKIYELASLELASND